MYIIQGIHKGMVRFQKLTRNLFLTLHGHNIHRQQRQLTKFLMRYQQFASHAYCGAVGPVSKMASQQEKASVCSVLRCPVLWAQCSVSFVHGLEKTYHASWKLAPRPRCKHEKRTAGSAWETWTVAAADCVRCARVRWEINFLLVFETAPFFCVYPVNKLQFYFLLVAQSLYVLGYPCLSIIRAPSSPPLPRITGNTLYYKR